MSARGLTVCVSAALVLAGGCRGGGDAPEAPAIVADIGPALAAIDAEQPDVELFQAAGAPGRVELVVSNGDSAVGYTFENGALSQAEQLGPADGYTFTPDDVAFDPQHVLDGILGELDDPTITRFEIVGGPNGVLYSAEVLSDAGGTLLIDVSGDGDVLGVVAR